MLKPLMLVAVAFLSSCAMLPVSKEKAQKQGIYAERTSGEQCLVLIKNEFNDAISVEFQGLDYYLQLDGQLLGTLPNEHHARFFIDNNSNHHLIARNKSSLSLIFGSPQDTDMLRCKNGETLGVWIETRCHNCLRFPRGRKFQSVYGPYIQVVSSKEPNIGETSPMKLLRE